MGNELVVRNELDIMSLGDVLAKSGFFEDSRQAAQAVVKVLAGQELGFGPVASMTGVNIIKGRVALSANLIAAAVKRSGKYNYRVTVHDDKECTIVFFENGEEVGISSFTASDAKRAQLSGANWTKYPRNMLFARAISNGAKFYCPDIFGGPVYTPDELGANVDGYTGEVIDGEFTQSSPASTFTGVIPPSADEITCRNCGIPFPKSWEVAPGICPGCEDDPATRAYLAHKDAERATTRATSPAPTNTPPPAQTPQNGNIENDPLWYEANNVFGFAESLMRMHIRDLPESVKWGMVVYKTCTESLGYRDDEHVKDTLGVDSTKEWDGYLGEMLIALLQNAPGGYGDEYDE